MWFVIENSAKSFDPGSQVVLARKDKSMLLLSCLVEIVFMTGNRTFVVTLLAPFGDDGFYEFEVMDFYWLLGGMAARWASVLGSSPASWPLMGPRTPLLYCNEY